jgi:hypothetical protein
METDPFTGRVIGCAIEVHRGFGPGLLESTFRLADGIKRFKLYPSVNSVLSVVKKKRRCAGKKEGAGRGA